MLELIQKIKDYTEAGIILEHMELFDELLEYTEDKENELLELLELDMQYDREE